MAFMSKPTNPESRLVFDEDLAESDAAFAELARSAQGSPRALDGLRALILTGAVASRATAAEFDAVFGAGAAASFACISRRAMRGGK